MLPGSPYGGGWPGGCPGQAQPDHVQLSRFTSLTVILALTIGAVVNHGSYSTEDTDLGEGPGPSPTSPDCASPSRQTRTTQLAPDPLLVRTVTTHARAVRSFLTLVKGGLRPPRSLAGPVRSSLRCGRPARRRRTAERPATREPKSSHRSQDGLSGLYEARERQPRRPA
jgi:hypothetical protein